MTNTLTKFQIKQVAMVEVYLANDMEDTAARSISALIRSASNCKQSNTLREIAREKGLDRLPEFIA